MKKIIFFIVTSACLFGFVTLDAMKRSSSSYTQGLDETLTQEHIPDRSATRSEPQIPLIDESFEQSDETIPELPPELKKLYDAAQSALIASRDLENPQHEQNLMRAHTATQKFLSASSNNQRLKKWISTAMDFKNETHPKVQQLIANKEIKAIETLFTAYNTNLRSGALDHAKQTLQDIIDRIDSDSLQFANTFIPLDDEKIGEIIQMFKPRLASIRKELYPQIDSFDLATLDLSTFTQVFCAYPEYVGDFRTPGLHNPQSLPSPKQCGVARTAFEEALSSFKKEFTRRTQYLQWIEGKKVDFAANRQLYTSLEDKTTAQILPTRYTIYQDVLQPTEIYEIGDIHGSVHSLIRILWRLVALGKLNHDLTINDPNFILVCKGDFVDRGSKGLEVITLLMALKLKGNNWHNIILLAGNHETGIMALHHGFFDELDRKYGQQLEIPLDLNFIQRVLNNKPIQALYKQVYDDFFDLLPVAYIPIHNGVAGLYCHGGIDDRIDMKDAMEKFMDDEHSIMYHNVGTEDECQRLFWNDFCALTQPDKQTSIRDNHAGTMFVDTCTSTKKYLEANRPLHYISRAHQDQYGALLFSNNQSFVSQKLGYDNGPFCWNEVADHDYPTMTDCIFKIHEFAYPVWTLSTATEARPTVTSDNFGCVRVGKQWEDWQLEIFDFYLGVNEIPHKRHGMYVHIEPYNPTCHTERITPQACVKRKDLIGIMWKPSFDKKQLIHDISRITPLIQGDVDDLET